MAAAGQTKPLTTNSRDCSSWGNQSFHTTEPFDPAASDLLYVPTDDRERYVIPTSAVRSGRQLNLGTRLAAYRVDGTRPEAEPPVGDG